MGPGSLILRRDGRDEQLRPPAIPWRPVRRRRPDQPVMRGRDCGALALTSRPERRVGARLPTEGYAPLAAWQPRVRAQRMVNRPGYVYIAVMRAVVASSADRGRVPGVYDACKRAIQAWRPDLA